MTVKQIDKLKTPRFMQQIESTLEPLEFLDRCAKNYDDLETLVVSHPQALQLTF